MKEFIALAKKQGGKMNAASGGNGSANHLALEMLKQRAGIQATHIPYKGSGPGDDRADERRSRFQFCRRAHIDATPSLRQDQGACRHDAQAVASGAGRAAADTLYPGFESTNWYGVFAPAGTPAAIVNKISQEIASAIQLPDVREFMAREGAEPVGSTPQEFAAFFKNEVDRYAQVIRSANIRVE